MSISTINWAVFDSANLASVVPGLSVLGMDPDVPPKRKLNISALAKTDRRKVSSGNWTDKAIGIRVGIRRNSRAEVEQSLDTMYGYLQGIEKSLLVPQSGTTRKYTATYGDTKILKRGASYWEAQLIFECSDAYGRDAVYTKIAEATGATSGSRQDQYDFQGSAATQAPYVRVIYTAITDGTTKSVYIGNSQTGQTITITRTWVATDVLEVNGDTGSVIVNGDDVDFTGAFPEFPKGLGTLTYSDNFTARTYNYLAYYYKRYS